MSIYQTRRKQATPGTQADLPSGAPGPVAQDSGAADSPPAETKAWMRKARPVEYMLPATVKWLEALPPEVRPVSLAGQYARIANLLAQHWSDDKACRAYFDELLTGRRGKRRGFPAHVRRELWVLREHYHHLGLRTGGHLAIV